MDWNRSCSFLVRSFYVVLDLGLLFSLIVGGTQGLMICSWRLFWVHGCNVDRKKPRWWWCGGGGGGVLLQIVVVGVIQGYFEDE